MARFRLNVDGWRHATKVNDAFQVIGWEDFKRGDVITLADDDEAIDRLVPLGALVPLVEEVAAVKEEVADSYDDASIWSFDDLKDLAGQRGLAKNGSRADVVARLREFDAAN